MTKILQKGDKLSAILYRFTADEIASVWKCHRNTVDSRRCNQDTIKLGELKELKKLGVDEDEIRKAIKF